MCVRVCARGDDDGVAAIVLRLLLLLLDKLEAFITDAVFFLVL